MAGRPESIRWLLVLLVECAVQAWMTSDLGGVWETIPDPSGVWDPLPDHRGAWETVPVVEGASLTLPCSYNCSSGFVRGYWCSESPHCWTKREVNRSGDFCTLSLHMDQVMRNHSHLRYTCLTCQSDQPGVPCSKDRQILLNISTTLTATSSPAASPGRTAPNDGAGDNMEDSPSDEFKVVKVLAVVALVAVVLLTSYLCFLRFKRKCAASSEKTLPYRQGSDKDHTSVTMTNIDCQSDHEVPYADIMISVRGGGSPELRALPGGGPGNPRARWRDDSGPGPLQHAFRSADRLHVQPKEVSRKLSSTSEYAVITYSAEALH